MIFGTGLSGNLGISARKETGVNSVLVTEHPNGTGISKFYSEQEWCISTSSLVGNLTVSVAHTYGWYFG